MAGLEALLALHDLAGSRVKVELLAPEQEFVYRPLAVAEPFRLAHPARIDLAEIAAGRPRSARVAFPGARRRTVVAYRGSTVATARLEQPVGHEGQ